jgi:hypothetical protein
MEVLADNWTDGRRVADIRFTNSMHDRLYIIVPDVPILAITTPDNERIELAESAGWVLRFDGMPAEAIEIRFEFSGTGSIRVLLVEERTGLPSFPGLVTRPEPGTMLSPGEFYQGMATDFTAISRIFVIPGMGP